MLRYNIDINNLMIKLVYHRYIIYLQVWYVHTKIIDGLYVTMISIDVKKLWWICGMMDMTVALIDGIDGIGYLRSHNYMIIYT